MNNISDISKGLGSKKHKLRTNIEYVNQILKTKLYIPTPRNNTITRMRLIKKLDLYNGHKLTLVSAPAGYGKTTLVSDWLKHINVPNAWISFDERDNDVKRFFTYFVAGLQGIDKNIGEVIHGLSGILQLPSVDFLMSTLINEISQLDKDFVIVFDDYHTIHNSEVHRAIQYLLDFLPSHMHIVMMTRETPPLMLSKFRVLGELIEITAKELCFTGDEVEKFFHNTMKLNIDKETTLVLNDRTEGWIAGLQLAGLSMQSLDTKNIERFVKEFSGSNRYILDFLIEEVLNQQDKHIRDFLCDTSLLGRFNAVLCDRITGRDDSKSILQYIYKSNLFLVPLDENGEWYRYHHLFSDILRDEVKEDKKSDIYVKASKYMEEKQLIIESVHYAIEAKDFKQAQRLIEKSGEEIISKGEFATILSWLNAMPPEDVVSNRVLELYRFAALVFERKMDQASVCLSNLENNEAVEKDAINYGKFLTLKATYLMAEENIDSLEVAKQAVELLNHSDSIFHVIAYHALGLSYNLAGNLIEANKAFTNALKLYQENQYILLTILGIYYRSINLIKMGYLKEVEEYCISFIKQYKEDNSKNKLCVILHAILGMIYYYRDDLINARKYLNEGIRICHHLNLVYLLGDAEVILSLVQHAIGDTYNALETIRSTKNIARKVNSFKVASVLDSLEVDIYLRVGHMEAAFNRFHEDFIIDSDIKPYLEWKYFSYVRILVVKSRIEESQKLLAKLEIIAFNEKRANSLITIHLLQAITYKLLDNELEWKRCLGKAICYAAPEGIFRSFLDEGKIVEEMVSMINHSQYQSFIDKLYLKFKNLEIENKFLQEQYKINANNPLSTREIEVLKLISLGYSNSDIAQKLFISITTAKSHVSNIHAKLDVKGRNQAVTVAKELGLI